MQTSWIIWGTLVVVGGAALAVVVRTKWLQSHTLQKCVILSVALHAVLAAVCGLLGGLAPASWGRDDAGRMTMMVVAAAEPTDESAVADTAPLPRIDAEPVEPAADAGTKPAEATADAPPLVGVAAAAGAAAGVPDHVVPLLDAPAEPVELAAAASAPAVAAAAPVDALSRTAAAAAEASPPLLPAAYADRVGPRRGAAAAARGGSQETERAVQSALAWLAAAQSSDGRWNAARHGGGVERSVQGHHRHGAGAKSDHGVTGLALLALLGAGNTHREGAYAETVDRGIRFLVERQRPDGSLAGEAEFFAALYCHGMATIALAECCAMTGDAALRPPLDRAVRHTLAMQSPATGGWRYAAGDRGDTSQLGWQVMVLSSSRNAGVAGLEQAEGRARLFLQSVSSGRTGGLASYRAGERPNVAMTAEALVCRLFLGMPPDHPVVGEAEEMIMRSLPDAASPNAYTWYYATLAMFHAGGPQWDRWNQQLQAALLPLQRRESSGLDGSWDPDPVWGGHGGRVYATAMAAMTLEVYYRHLPMHRQTPRMATAVR
jgi:hypothetical protein